MKTSILLSIIALSLAGCTTTYVQIAAPRPAKTRHHVTHTRTMTTVETTPASTGDGEIHFIRPGQTSFKVNSASGASSHRGGSRSDASNDTDSFTATTR